MSPGRDRVLLANGNAVSTYKETKMCTESRAPGAVYRVPLTMCSRHKGVEEGLGTSPWIPSSSPDKASDGIFALRPQSLQDASPIAVLADPCPRHHVQPLRAIMAHQATKRGTPSSWDPLPGPRGPQSHKAQPSLPCPVPGPLREETHYSNSRVLPLHGGRETPRAFELLFRTQRTQS